MDDKKRSDGGFGSKPADRPGEQWGAAGREDVGGGRFAPGEVRDSRDLTEGERGQLLSGYTSHGEDEGIDQGIQAGSFGTGPGLETGGMSSVGAMNASSKDVDRPGAASTTGVGYGQESYRAGTQAGEFSGSGMSMGAAGSSGSASAAKEKVKEVGAKVMDKAKGQVDARKGEVAEQLEGLTSNLHEKLSGKADEYISQVSMAAETYASKAAQLLREKNADDLLVMAKDEFRQRPLALAAGAFALGFLGARLLRS